MVVREPYLPQKLDLGFAIGTTWSTTNYILAEAFAGLRTTPCGFHCFQYIDIAGKVAAQNGQTDYQVLAGWRFQKYIDDSSWGPYLRPFIGNNHYLYGGEVKDTFLGGLAAGANYFLHPSFDFRLEIGEAVGPQSFTFLTVGTVIKLRNI